MSLSCNQPAMTQQYILCPHDPGGLQCITDSLVTHAYGPVSPPIRHTFTPIRAPFPSSRCTTVSLRLICGISSTCLSFPTVLLALHRRLLRFIHRISFKVPRLPHLPLLALVLSIISHQSLQTEIQIHGEWPTTMHMRGEIQIHRLSHVGPRGFSTTMHTKCPISVYYSTPPTLWFPLLPLKPTRVSRTSFPCLSDSLYWP
jgi:hypothetical protein